MNRILLLYTYIFISGNMPIFGSASIVNEDIIYIQFLAISNIFLNILYPVYRSNHLKSGFSLLWKPFSKENSNLFVCPTLCQASWFDGMEKNNVFLLKHTNAIRSMPWYLYDMLCCLRDVRFPTMHKNERYIISM